MDLFILAVIFVMSGLVPLLWVNWIMNATQESREEKKPLNLVKRKNTTRGPTPSEIAKKGYSPSISIEDVDSRDI